MAASYDSGAGSRLPTAVLVVAGVSTVVAVLVSAMSIYLQLKNYRKPVLQRMVVRIMVMVPIYAVSSLIALFSLEAAFVIDAIRDIYEAFVIYCFFVLLLSYLGGERSLLILLHGRPPKDPVFPVSLFKREIDVSDPYTFLFLKRGILQYVQVKPVLAAATLILKACGKFNEGDFRANSGYLYVSIIYNTSICLSLYCLAMFWLFVNEDLKPFRPVPKFLCVKGILFFSFWQSIGISILVAAGAITKLGPYTDPEHISVGLTDTLICIEMPFFAFAHMFAFSHTDYIDPHRSYVARMPMYYAFRDAFGLLDVIEDTKATLRGEGMDYREFEPAEGIMHQGDGRDRRIRAGLRYSKGGQRKYWLPRPTKDSLHPGRVERGVNHAITKVLGNDQGEAVHAPLFAPEADEIVHLAPDLQDPDEDPDMWGSSSHAEDGYELPFGDPNEEDDELFNRSTKYLFGDYNYPCIDVSSEYARAVMWDEEERVLRDERGAWFSPIRGAKGRAALERREEPAWQGYGAVGSTIPGWQKAKGGIPDEEDEWDNRKTINHEEARAQSSAKPADVRMRWTKTKDGPSHHTHSASPHVRQRPGVQASSSQGHQLSVESSSTAANRLLSPALTTNTSARYSPGAERSPVLPPDAVDLVVEDEAAAQEEQTRERRKGEPAVRGAGLRKVYRRGFIGEPQDAEGRRARGEIEIEGGGQGRVEAGQEIIGELEDGSKSGNSSNDDDNRTYWEVEPGGTAEGVVARAGTPPLHARMVVHDFDNENPWA